MGHALNLSAGSTERDAAKQARSRHFTRLALWLALAWPVCFATHAAETADGLLLVARPGLADPNFRETVIVVAQTGDGAALGVIINRPTRQSLAGILPDNQTLKQFTEPIYFGGPVEPNGIFAVFQSQNQASDKPGQIFPVLADVHLALHPETVEKLMTKPPARLRFYTGYSGWAPGQLRGEIERGDWYVMDADAATIFRTDMDKLWPELLHRARSVTAAR
jgi:putative transcriptional regulator